MISKVIAQNVSNYGFKTYEGSYLDIFSVLDYIFLPFQVVTTIKKSGRSAFPQEILFKAYIVHFIISERSFRLVKPFFRKKKKSQRKLAFSNTKTPRCSILKICSKKLPILSLRQFYKELNMELLAEKIIILDVVALDSVSFEMLWKIKTKKNPRSFVFNLCWRFVKFKYLYYLGYKTNIFTDIKSILTMTEHLWLHTYSIKELWIPSFNSSNNWMFFQRFYLQIKDMIPPKTITSFLEN